MKKKLQEMLAKKEARKAELNKKVEAATSVEELRGIKLEIDALNTEIAEYRGLIDASPDDGGTGDGGQPPLPGQEQRGGSPVGQTAILGTYGLGGSQPGAGEQRHKEMEQLLEQRGADLKAKKAVTFSTEELPELRAVTIGSGQIVAETKYAPDIKPTFNEVSRVIDVVNVVTLVGGESYKVGFEISSGEGDYTSETGVATDADPDFGYVNINKTKITAYAEISEEVSKLPNMQYQERVRNSITKAVRKKLSRQILAGPGGAEKLSGIFAAPVGVIPVESDIKISEIDGDTLDQIVIGYGGDEEVEGEGYLILSKKDLAAFAAVRTADGKKLYKIKRGRNGITGTISSEESFEVPYIINSACPALSSAQTAVDTYCMAYGMTQGYELAIFSDLTVQESSDYKFKEGQIAFRGSVMAGGSVAMYKGFVRVKKAAAV